MKKIFRIFLVPEKIGYGGADQVYMHLIDYYKDDNIYKLVLNKRDTFDNYLLAIDNAKKDLLPYINEKIYIYSILDGKFVNENVFAYLKNTFNNSKIIMYSGGNSIFQRIFQFNKSADYINKYVDLLIANSRFSYDRYIEWGIKKDILFLIRGGVNYNFEHLTREELILPLHSKLICMASRFIKWKGLYDTISSLNLNENLQLVLVGDSDNLKDEYRCDNEEFNNCIDNEYIHYFKHVDNNKLLSIIENCDIFINCPNPYIRECNGKKALVTETFGRTLCESISVGTPIIALNTGAIKEFFDENNYIGKLINDRSELNDAINEVLIKGRIKSNIDYSWNTYFKKLDCELIKRGV